MVAQIVFALFLAADTSTNIAPVPSQSLLAPDGQPITQKDRDALEQGKVLVQLTAAPGSAVKKSAAIALIDAAPDAIFAVLTDYADFPSFMPYCKTTEVHKKVDEESTVYFALDFPWPLGDKHYILHLTDRQHDISGSPVYTSSWTYEPDSGNINDSYGSWEVRAYDSDRSFVRYTVFTDPGGSIPAWANNMATEVAVPKVFEGVRKRTKEKSPTQSKSKP